MHCRTRTHLPAAVPDLLPALRTSAVAARWPLSTASPAWRTAASRAQRVDGLSPGPRSAPGRPRCTSADRLCNCHVLRTVPAHSSPAHPGCPKEKLCFSTVRIWPITTVLSYSLITSAFMVLAMASCSTRCLCVAPLISCSINLAVSPRPLGTFLSSHREACEQNMPLLALPRSKLEAADRRGNAHLACASMIAERQTQRSEEEEIKAAVDSGLVPFDSKIFHKILISLNDFFSSFKLFCINFSVWVTFSAIFAIATLACSTPNSVQSREK